MTKYIVKDWAGNILDFKGRLNSKEFAVVMEFDDEDSAREYIDEHFSSDWEELHVAVKGA